MLKSILTGAIILLLTSTAGAERSVQWGSLLKDIATLTWAEKNCSGLASDAVRELRLYFRKHVNAEFEEALIEVGTDFRESIDDGAPILSERDAIAATCTGLGWMYGEHGSRLPTLWRDNRPRPPRRDPSRPPIFLPAYGQFVGVLSLIEQMRARCNGSPSALAQTFITAFVGGGGEKEFKRLGEVERRYYREAELCEAINNDFGPSAKEWPVLWYSEQAGPRSSLALDKEQIPPPSVLAPTARASIFRHGAVRRAPVGDAITPFSIKTNPGAGYFIKLVRPADGQEQIAAFVLGGRPFSTKVPPGTYELRYAVGQDWIDEQEYFGPKTAFYKADRLLTFSIEGDRVLGSEVELILQHGGNLRTSTISKDRF